MYTYRKTQLELFSALLRGSLNTVSSCHCHTVKISVIQITAVYTINLTSYLKLVLFSSQLTVVDMDRLLNGPIGHKPRGPRGQNVTERDAKQPQRDTKCPRTDAKCLEEMKCPQMTSFFDSFYMLRQGDCCVMICSWLLIHSLINSV